jgi:hypothetical protein
MQIVRIYTGADGQSHFQDVDVEMTESGAFGRMSRMHAARGVIFREVGGDYDLDFHNAPRRQYVVNLTGAVDIEIGDGTRRRLGPGSILLAEDTTGQGHKSAAVAGAARTCLFIPLE